MKKSKKLLSVILALTLLLSNAAIIGTAAAEKNCECGYYPTIIVPGVFQSEVKLCDENGNEKFNSDGEAYSSPFFMESTNDIVKKALEKALLPIGGMLITQQDKQKRCAQAIADVLTEALMGNIQCDENGTPINNLKVSQYNTNVANLSDYDREYVLGQIPIAAYDNIAGFDHLYFYSYLSTGSVKQNALGLYELIQTAKAETGHDKVNIIPISQGGSLFNALMQVYIDKGENLADDIHRVCLIVPAADGSALFGSIYRYGFIDDDEALYGYMLPSLMEEDQEWLAYLINLVLRIIPNADLKQILDAALTTLADEGLSYSTAMWALIPSYDYPACREKYLSSPEKAKIREEADWYYNAQCNRCEYIKTLQEKGVEFFDIVDYNYELYRLCDCWDDVNGDGIIHVDSESFGATSIGVNKTLTPGYKQKNTYCTNPEHNHIDEARLIDASTGLLCETTFYFKDQDHEKTARNDVIIRLAIRIVTDDSFKDVYSDPAFPQFNYARNVRSMQELLEKVANLKPENVTELYRNEYTEALNAAVAANDSTFMKTDDYNAAYERLNNIVTLIETNAAPQKEEQSGIIKLLTAFLKKVSDFMLKFFGGKSFSDIIFFRKVS